MELYSLNEAFYIRQTMNPLSAGQIALWHAIVRIANKCHWQEWFSVANITLVQLSGLSLAGVKQARNVLKQHGLIDFKPNGTKATLYVVCDITQDDMQESSRVSSRNCSRNYSQDCSQNYSRNYSRNCSSLINNTEQNNNTPLTPQGFSEFWKAYPRKVGKATAEKAWAKLKVTDELHSTILAALEKHKVSDQWTKDGGQFIPHPSTWLNQRRWEDELEAAQPEEPVRQISWVDGG